MKFSIVVPVYNVEEYIVKCLISIKNQTLTDFECLIVNDGTKDNSISKAKDVVGDDERFVFFDKVNGGLSDARNYGIKKAKGDYIWFVDSDDYIEEKSLEKIYSSIQENKADICVFGLFYEDQEKREVSTHIESFDVSNYKENKELLNIVNSANNKVFKRELIVDKSFIVGIHYEDLATIPVWISQANTISNIKEPLYHYVQREGSITHSKSEKIFDIYFAIDNIKKELNLKSYDVKNIYFNDCLIMTTLRIKDWDKKEDRLEYYKMNIDKLNKAYPSWYRDIKKEAYSTKQKIIFWLLKNNMFNIVDMIYSR